MTSVVKHVETLIVSADACLSEKKKKYPHTKQQKTGHCPKGKQAVMLLILKTTSSCTRTLKLFVIISNHPLLEKKSIKKKKKRNTEVRFLGLLMLSVLQPQP